jgi:butyrate kinase
MNYYLLVINPGSTSTKVACYENEEPVWTKTVAHTSQELSAFRGIAEQLDMRKTLVLDAMAEKGTLLSSLSAVVGRGGLLPPVQSGAYLVNPEMVHILLTRPVNEHASNLGAAIAYEIARPLGIPAYIYDPVTVDEMAPIAKVTGLKEMKRIGQGHNLNMRAAAIKYAKSINRAYNSLNIIVAHLGGGITLSLHSRGRMIDINSDYEGPFSPERAGGLPGFQLIRMAASGEYDYKTMMNKVQRQGGLVSYFGISDLRDILQRMAEGDGQARLVLEAMAYNIAKSIGKLTVVVSGRVDAIVLTGGMAYSDEITRWIEERVRFIAPVYIIAGENEMEALALGTLRVLRGEETAKVFEEC